MVVFYSFDDRTAASLKGKEEESSEGGLPRPGVKREGTLTRGAKNGEGMPFRAYHAGVTNKNKRRNMELEKGGGRAVIQ